MNGVRFLVVWVATTVIELLGIGLGLTLMGRAANIGYPSELGGLILVFTIIVMPFVHAFLAGITTVFLLRGYMIAGTVLLVEGSVSFAVLAEMPALFFYCSVLTIMIVLLVAVFSDHNRSYV